MAARYRVLMVGGPHDGRLFDYNTPLPAVLVFQGRFGDDEHITVANYRRQEGTRRYVHEPNTVAPLRSTQQGMTVMQEGIK